jgi:predicted DCC family thiol-disulfide oxidoreductase YuxK
MPRPVLFYDGGCPMCSKEIAHYQRLDKQQRVNWVNIATQAEQLEPYRIEFADAMARLHMIDEHGQVKSGAYAFNALWKHLPYYRWLAVVTQFNPLLRVMDWAYDHFAAWRLRRRQCEVA